jgi:hypothetical protein
VTESMPGKRFTPVKAGALAGQSWSATARTAAWKPSMWVPE